MMHSAIPPLSSQQKTPATSCTLVQKCTIAALILSIALLTLGAMSLAGIYSPSCAFGTLGDQLGELGTYLISGSGIGLLIGIALDYCIHHKSAPSQKKPKYVSRVNFKIDPSTDKSVKGEGSSPDPSIEASGQTDRPKIQSWHKHRFIRLPSFTQKIFLINHH